MCLHIHKHYQLCSVQLAQDPAHGTSVVRLDVVSKSVERWLPVNSLIPGRDKPMTYNKHCYLSLPSLVISINRIVQGLVSSVSG